MRSSRCVRHLLNWTWCQISSGNWIYWWKDPLSMNSFIPFTKWWVTPLTNPFSSSFWRTTPKRRRGLDFRPSSLCGRRISFTGRSQPPATMLKRTSLSYLSTPNMRSTCWLRATLELSSTIEHIAKWSWSMGNSWSSPKKTRSLPESCIWKARATLSSTWWRTDSTAKSLSPLTALKVTTTSSCHSQAKSVVTLTQGKRGLSWSSFRNRKAMQNT